MIDEQLIQSKLKELEGKSTCNRRQVGAIIVTNGKIISTGYNHAIVNACDECPRIKLNAPSGEMLDKCYAIHAEQHALINLIKKSILEPINNNTIMYISCKPYSTCTKLIIESGIKNIKYYSDYNDEFTDKLLESNLNIIE